MPEIRFDQQSLHEKARPVFGEGMLITKTGVPYATPTVYGIIRETGKLIQEKKGLLLTRIQSSVIGVEADAGLKEDLGERGIAFLNGDGEVMDAAVGVLNDIVMPPLLGGDGQPHIDASHYIEQLNARAIAHGISIRYGGGSFQVRPLLGG